MAEPLGQRIRRLRLARGLTQIELAEPAYSAAYVSTIEAGRRNPSPAAIKYLAERLGVHPEELATGRSREREARLQIRLQEAFSALFSGRHDRAAELLTDIADAASREGLPRVEAKAQEGRGILAERAGRPAEAAERFDAAIELLKDEPLPLSAEAVSGLARCRQMLGEVRVAIHILESYLLRLEKEHLQDPVAIMRTYSSLIWPLSEAGLHQDCKHAAEEALKLEPHVHQSDQVANMHLNVARELLRQGLVEDALASLTRAEDIYRSLNWKTELARAHGNRAIVLAEQGDLSSARHENLKALELVKGSSNRLTEARALNELARVDRLSGNVEAAKSGLTRAISLLDEADVVELALSHRELGLCALAEEKFDIAERQLRRAIGLYRRAQVPLEVAATFRELGDVLSARGQLEGSRQAYREGLMALEEPSAA